STNRGQQVMKKGAPRGSPGYGMGSVPAGGGGSSPRSPLARSSTPVWTACWASGAGPRSGQVVCRRAGAEGDRGREGVLPVQIDGRFAEGWPEPKALVAARRPEATATGAVGADHEEPVVLRW